MNDYCAFCNLVVVKYDPNRMQLHRTFYHRHCFIAALKQRFDMKDANERDAQNQAPSHPSV